MCAYPAPDRELLGLGLEDARAVVRARRDTEPGVHPIMTRQAMAITRKIVEADAPLTAVPKRQKGPVGGVPLELHLSNVCSGFAICLLPTLALFSEAPTAPLGKLDVVVADVEPKAATAQSHRREGGGSRAHEPVEHQVTFDSSQGSSWLNLVERWFAELTTKLLQRGAHRSVAALNADIRAWMKTRNDDPRPYVWTKTADQILAHGAVALQPWARSGSLRRARAARRR